MKACFLCGNQFQIVNCVNFVINQKEYCFERVDCYIIDVLPNAQETVDKLRKEKIFDRVFEYSYEKMDTGFLSSLIFRETALISPCRFIKGIIKNDKHEAMTERYSQIFMFGYDYISRAMVMANPAAEVIFLDDGFASYVGRNGEGAITRNRRIIWRMTGKDYRHLYPKKLYVNNPALCHTEWNVPVKALPVLNENKYVMGIMKRIFKPSMEEYNSIRTVILSQNFTGESPEKDYEIIYCKDKSVDFIWRPHPRLKVPESEIIYTDRTGALWELICAEKINDEHILIGKCSTAQISPKLLFDKEPYIVFTYRLYEYISEEMRKDAREMCLNIREMYRNPEKVIDVANQKELSDVLDRLYGMDRA